MIFVQRGGVVIEDKSEEGGKSKQRAREKERRQEAREREGRRSSILRKGRGKR